MSQAGWADIISNGPGLQDGRQDKLLHINPKRRPLSLILHPLQRRNLCYEIFAALLKTLILIKAGRGGRQQNHIPWLRLGIGGLYGHIHCFTNFKRTWQLSRECCRLGANDIGFAHSACCALQRIQATFFFSTAANPPYI